MTIPNGLSSSKKPASTVSTVSFPSQGSEKESGKRGPAGKRRGTGCAGFCGVLSGLIIAAFLGAALVVYRNHELFSFALYTGYHDGDQIVASREADSYNSLLCQTYTVTAWSDSERGASFYLTDGPATVDPEAREVIVISNSGLRSDEEFDYRAFYLLPGSEIQTSACMSVFNQFPRIHAEVLFIKGTNDFEQWTYDASCAKCVAHRVIISPDQLCEAREGVFTRVVVDHADTYYVVITRQHRSEDDAVFRADVTMRVIKTVYDVSHAKQKCLQTTSCAFNLTFNADDDIIVQFPLQEFSPADPDNSFNTNCGIRMTFFLILFVLIPGSLILVLTLVSCLCCMRQDGHAKNSQLQKKKAEVRAAFTAPEQKSQDTLPQV